MVERTDKEISERIKHFELMMQKDPHNELIEFIQGALSALYWIMKQTNPYTGQDMSKV